jgi:hypothetical protein
LGVLFVVAALSACDGADPVGLVELEGSYIIQTRSSGAPDAFCSDLGRLTLKASGSTLTGTLESAGECSGQATPRGIYVRSGNISQGLVADGALPADVSFRDADNCGFDGIAVRRGSTVAIQGHMVCPAGFGGGSTPVAGLWGADKQHN